MYILNFVMYFQLIINSNHDRGEINYAYVKLLQVR